MHKLLFILFVAFSAFLLAGCQSQMTVPDGVLPVDFKAQTVSIKPMMTIVKEPFVQTPGELWGGGIGGLIGAAIAAGATTEGQYVAFLKQSNIDLKKIVTQSFEHQLSAAGAPLQWVKTKADIEIMLGIPFYGIHPAGPFSDAVEPMLEVEVSVFVNNGQHISTISESIKFPDDDWVKAIPMEEYVENPALLAKGYTRLSDKIVDALIQQLASLGSP